MDSTYMQHKYQKYVSRKIKNSILQNKSIFPENQKETELNNYFAFVKAMLTFFFKGKEM